MNRDGQHRLGIDFGRVIQGAAFAAGAADTVFLSGGIEQALASPPSAEEFEAWTDVEVAVGATLTPGHRM
ncbi:hypothetical protein ACW2Q0_29565 [Nocardia sp. R16R-3T]